MTLLMVHGGEILLCKMHRGSSWNLDLNGCVPVSGSVQFIIYCSGPGHTKLNGQPSNIQWSSPGLVRLLCAGSIENLAFIHSVE